MCARVCASPPSLTVTAGAADLTTLNKRKPFPSLLRSQCVACVRTCVRACSRVAARPYVCAAEKRGNGGGRRWRRAVGVGWDRREAAHIILRASSGWSPLRITAHSAKQQWERRAFVHISIRSAFSSIKQTQLCPCCHLPDRHLDSWSPSYKETPPAAQEERAPLSVEIIKGELFTPTGNKTYLQISAHSNHGGEKMLLPLLLPSAFIALKQILQTAKHLSMIG